MAKQGDPDFILPDGIRRNASAKPDTPALRFKGEEISYATLNRRCDRTAAALIDVGVRPGDRICYWGKNSDAFIELLFGSMRARCCLVPVNWRLTIAEARNIVEDAGATLIFADDHMLDGARTLSGQIAALADPIAIRSPGSGLVDYHDWRDSANEAVIRRPSPEDAFLQIYTSGTTGLPKGVLMTRERYGAHLARLRAVDAPWLTYGPDDHVLVAMPFFHLSGICPTLDAIHVGARIVLLSEFSADHVVEAIVTQGITRTFTVPAALRTLVEDPRLQRSDQTKLRYLMYGASPIDPAFLKTAMATLGCEFVHFYGMTESLNYITALSPQDHRVEGGDRWRSVGRAVPGMSVRIAGPDDQPIPTGTIGEIQMKASFLTNGYWRKPGETAAAFSADGWLKSGDAGRMDEDGYLYIEDRIRDMIISGGENVFPLEVESTLNAHPAVAECGVIGAPDPRWGERVVAFVVASDDKAPDAAELIDWSRGHLAPYKCPKDIRFVDHIPRNASGKILKRELRQWLLNAAAN